MVPNELDLVGRWSEDFGYKTDLSRDTVIEFREDGTGVIISADERIDLRWELAATGKLIMVVHGNRLGPFNVRISNEHLPLGEFTVLESDSWLLPFDRRRFTKLSDDIAVVPSRC